MWHRELLRRISVGERMLIGYGAFVAGGLGYGVVFFGLTEPILQRFGLNTRAYLNAYNPIGLWLYENPWEAVGISGAMASLAWIVCKRLETLVNVALILLTTVWSFALWLTVWAGLDLSRLGDRRQGARDAQLAWFSALYDGYVPVFVLGVATSGALLLCHFRSWIVTENLIQTDRRDGSPPITDETVLQRRRRFVSAAGAGATHHPSSLLFPIVLPVLWVTFWCSLYDLAYVPPESELARVPLAAGKLTDREALIRLDDDGAIMIGEKEFSTVDELKRAILHLTKGGTRPARVRVSAEADVQHLMTFLDAAFGARYHNVSLDISEDADVE